MLFDDDDEEVLGEYCQDGSDDDFSDLEWLDILTS